MMKVGSLRHAGQASCRRKVSWCTTTSSFVASHLSMLDGWGARTTNEAPPMRTTRHPRIRVALRLFSNAFVVTALLASGGTASAAKKKAADQAETTEAAPAEQTSAPAESAPVAAPAPAPAPAPVAAPAPAPAPAAAPEEATTQPEPGAASPQRKRSTRTTELGLSPQTTSYAADNTGPPVVTEAPSEDWGFKFHGFFRGPMRLSMDTETGQGLQFHAPPVTPDLN